MKREALMKCIILLDIVLLLLCNNGWGGIMVTEEGMHRYKEWIMNTKENWDKDKINDSQKIFFRKNNIELKDIKTLSKKETAELRDKWYSSFLKTIPEKYPKDFYRHRCEFCDNRRDDEPGGYNWHIFSFKLADHESVKRDFLKHYKIREETLIITWEKCKYLAIEMPANLVKNINFRNEDIYIFPRNFAWTFVNTHEDEYTHGFECFFATNSF